MPFHLRSTCVFASLDWLVSRFRGMALVAASPRPRIKAPEVAVSSPEEMIDDYLQLKGSRDLLRHLASVRDIAWSHAPKAVHILEYAQLFFSRWSWLRT